jgi:hypothetical protein
MRRHEGTNRSHEKRGQANNRKMCILKSEEVMTTLKVLEQGPIVRYDKSHERGITF